MLPAALAGRVTEVEMLFTAPGPMDKRPLRKVRPLALASCQVTLLRMD